MKCPKCSSPRIRVRDSRRAEDGGSVKRQRVCRDCDMQWVTLEVDVDQIPLQHRAMTPATIRRRGERN